MNYIIIYLILFDTFYNVILYSLKLINIKYFYNNNTTAETDRIVKLENEIKDLNTPSTFKEYVKKSRELHILKRNKEKESLNVNNNNINLKRLYYIMNIFDTILNVLKFLPMNLKKILLFIIISRYLDRTRYIVHIDKRIYSPFYQNGEDLIHFNIIISYGIMSNIYNFIKVIIKYSYYDLNLKRLFF